MPGPRARARNRMLSLISTLAVVALIGYVIYKLYATGQFESIKWQQFEYKAIQMELLAGFAATLRAAAVGAVLALVLGALLASARLSDHAGVRVPATVIVELFRAIPL